MNRPLLAIVGFAFIISSTALGLEAGVAVCDITPDVDAYNVPMAGYGARNGKPSEGVRDPLRAKVLYLRDGAVQAVLITCDLRSMTPEIKAGIVSRVSDLGLSLDNVMVCASHNHSGPSFYRERFWQLQFGIFDPAILEPMTAAIGDAVRRAHDAVEPVTAGLVKGFAEGFTRNRRWEYDEARRVAAGEQPAVNPALSVLRLDSDDHKPLAVLIHFATHPTILGADNMQLSSEWPGVLQREVEAAFPGAVGMYANGAEGDQAPAGATGDDAYARVQDFGGRLAAIAVGLAREVELRPDVALNVERITPELPPFEFSENARNGQYAHLMSMAKDQLPRRAEIQLIRLGDWALVGLPGEPVCAVGWATEAWVRNAGFSEAIVVGLANDYIGYILNAQEYGHGGYEVDLRSYYGPGLGSFIGREAGGLARTVLAE